MHRDKIPRMKIYRICKVCGNEFWTVPSVIASGSGKCCSIGCRGKSMITSPTAKFIKFTKRDSNTGCLLWTSTINKVTQYGQVNINGKTHNAPRFFFQYFLGPIPKHIEVDHLCRNHVCVNPEHLEPVTHKINIHRGISPMAFFAKRTHCSRGHGYTPANTRIAHDGSRVCRRCDALDHAAKRMRPIIYL